MDQDDKIKELQDENAELRHANEGESNRLSVAELVDKVKAKVKALDKETMNAIRNRNAQILILESAVRTAHDDLAGMDMISYAGTIIETRGRVAVARRILREAIEAVEKARKQ